MPLTPPFSTQRTSEAPPSTGGLSLSSIVGFLIFVEFVSGMIQAYYPPLLADLGADLHVGAGPLNWFNSVQLLAAAVSVPIFAALGDRYGHRRLLTIAIWSVAVGAALTALAPTYPVVLLGRILQGPLAVWIALEIALVRSRATGARANRAIGLLAGALTGGAVVGGLVSGHVESLLGGVGPAMAVPMVLSVLCALVTMFVIPESTTRTPRSIDWVGAAGLSIALIALLLGLVEANRVGWTAVTTWGGIGLGLVAMAVWVGWERRTTTPLVDVRLLTSRSMWPAMVATLMFGVCFFGNQIPLVTFLAATPQVLGYGFGLSTQSISLVVSANYLVAVIGSALYGPIAERLGPRGVLPLGIGLAAAGFVSLALLHSALWMIVGALVASGLGMGLLLGGLPAYISGVAPRDQVAIASGTYSTVKVVGGSIASAVVGALLSSFIPGRAEAPTVTGYSVVWFTCAGAALLALLVLTLAWTGRRPACDAHE
ncbi:major facilitator superfamily transporter [Nocardia nova SH22a]|uniref:Major facilitator superfamily transporter n=1 Tax=Nocardia nova SH22a TaxID=1415166 RepID=W5TV12_9NOCA|nr:MFS transporter [Nocardia nova]AHH21011.1 major facilitator superfamily transporter [Nocardia nova SH22a]